MKNFFKGYLDSEVIPIGLKLITQKLTLGMYFEKILSLE